MRYGQEPTHPDHLSSNYIMSFGWYRATSLVIRRTSCIDNKYSLLVHRIKNKSPAIFHGMNKTFFCVDLNHFLISLTQYYNDKKAYRILAVPFKMSAAMGLAMEPGVHIMSDELILQISYNIFLAFKWISMMRSGHNISHYTTAKPSVKKNITTRLRLRALKPK